MRIAIFATIAAVVLPSFGCGSASTDAGSILTGAYELSSVNGASMPVMVSITGSSSINLKKP